MTLIQDRRFIALVAFVLAAHMASFWAEIQQGMGSLAHHKKTREEAPKITLIPLTEQQLAAYKTRNQIVQNDDTGRKEKPTGEAFLGEKDMSYDRQTVARKVDIFNKAGKGSSEVAATRTAPTPKSEAKPEKAPAKKALKDLKLSDLGMQMMEKPQPRERQPAAMAKQGVANGDTRSQGVSRTNDFIEHAKLGDFTQLNTVEFKYYGFYHRIRGKLEQFWGRSLKEKADALSKSGRTIASDDQYTTSLVITMNEKGEIIGVVVKGSSGVKELDEAAIESFNQAGPFPNPPSGLLVNGKATIEWGFVVNS